MKIAFIVEFPTQFEVPFYQYIDRWIKEQRVKGFVSLPTGQAGAQPDKSIREHFDFHVIYNYTDQQDYHDFELGKKVGWGFNLYEGYRYFIADKNDILSSIDKIIKVEKYDFVILNGYKNTYKGLPALIKEKNISIGLRIDSVIYNLPFYKKILKRLYLPYAYRHFNHFFAVGSETKKFLGWLGINNQRMSYFSYATNDDWFKIQSQNKNKIKEIKDQWNIQTNQIIISVAKFVERESPWDTLKAFVSLNNPEITLILIGDGPDRDALVEFAQQYQHLKIIFTGYILFTELPFYYGLSKLFIHAAKNEPWGVSVQEALSCNCVVIASNKVGSAKDLLLTNKNGYTYTYGNVAELKHLIPLALALAKEDLTAVNDAVLSQWNYNNMWLQIQEGTKKYINRKS